MKKSVGLIASLAVAIALSLISCSSSADGGGKKIDNSGCPVFSPIGGFYREAQTVTITCPGAKEIYYTTDMTKPAVETATKYEGPFQVNEQCIIRSMAVYADGTEHFAMTAFDFDLDHSTDSNSRMDSPNWQDQVIYFVMTDRFANGDKTNDKLNIQYNDGTPYDETVPLMGQNVSGYNGGDFKGLTEKLDYIKSLGATAIWVTPPVKNQVSEGAYHGFHGYWASDFTQVDPHNGSLKDYQDFVKAAHDKGLYVIQDIVVNHTGDFQKGDSVITPKMLENGSITDADFCLNQNSVLCGGDSEQWSHPEQLPWKFNDVRDLTADELKNNSFYHFNPCISNFVDSTQTYTYQESGLDDINTNNPVVRNLLRGYFRYWIDKVDIDGYRIDTALYVEPDFFEGFINGVDAGNEGVREYARKLGKTDFIDFGEAWTSDERVSAGYTKNPKSGAKRMDSIIYFPLTMALRDCVSGNGGTDAITSVLNNRSKVGYDNPNRSVNFIDNHDLERLITIADPEMVKAAYALIMSIPGVPQFYYGTEQGFTVTRKAMFRGGYGGDIGNTRTTNTQDFYDQSGEWWNFVKDLIQLRKDNRVFRYNTSKVIKDSNLNPGIFALGIQGLGEDGKNLSGAGCRALFVMNTSDSEQLLNCVPNYPSQNNLKIGDRLVKMSPSSSALPAEVVIGEANGVTAGTKVSTLQMVVPPKSYAIYLLEEENVSSAGSSHSISILETDGEKDVLNNLTGDDLKVRFYSTDVGTVKAVLNSDYSNAQSFTISEDNLITTDGSGRELDVPYYEIEVSIGNLSNGTSNVELELTSAGGSVIYSKGHSIKILRPFVKLDSACIVDPEGDNHGPEGYNYSLPTGFDAVQDILGVDVKLSGKDIQLDIKMKGISRSWNPTSNLFDHVGFNVFVSVPGSTKGCAVQPEHNYTLPNDFKWDYWFRAYGWSSAYYSSVGANATERGTSKSNSPYTSVIWPEDATVKELSGDDAVVTVTILSKALDNIQDIDGVKIYINTFDMDFDQLRGMVNEEDFAPDRYSFGAGAGVDKDAAPKVIDETGIITIRTE